MTTSIVFLDFEASSLSPESWPVEVGYAGACGAEDAFLLSRHREWSMEYWDRNSANLHGISLADLDEFGVPAEAAIDRLAKKLGNAIVVSDAPDFENHWLRRISTAAGKPTPFVVQDWEEYLPAGQSEAERKALTEQARKQEGVRHRAGPDARVMRAVWRASWALAQADWGHDAA
ncbi:MAG: hypothetical protein WDN76_09305 [Alphaproteobacteria bacterium]